MCPRCACVARQGPEPLEVELNEARLRLEELEMRKSVRDASEDKYRQKMPAIKWEIGQYKMGLKAKIILLHDHARPVLSRASAGFLHQKS